MREGGPPLVLSVFSTFGVGGPQVRFVTVANRLGTAFRHAIIAMDGALDCAQRLAPELDVALPPVTIRKGDTLGNVRRFRRVLRRIRPDVLVTYNWGAIEWVLANFWPVVRHVHVEDGFGPDEQTAQFARRVLVRRAVLRHIAVVLPSHTLWRVATEIWRLPTRCLRLIPNAVDLDHFTPATDRTRQDGVIIGTVATLRGEKNLPRLLHAFRQLPPTSGARLVIVGDGPERGALEALAVEIGLGARVRFTGAVADPSSILRTFDIFALSSDQEQMPLSVIEAMGAGLPVAGTNAGDVRAMVADENRPFVVAKEEGALAGAMGRLAADVNLRARLGAANRAKAEREFDLRVMVDAYRQLFSNSDEGRDRPDGHRES